MYCSVIHRIDNPEKFWGQGEKLLASLPDGFEVLSTYPNHDGTRAVCLWQCPSVDDLKDLLEGEVGAISRNDYFEVDVSKASGLPRPSGTQATGPGSYAGGGA